MKSLKKRLYNIKTEVWLYPSEAAAWHFVSVPKKESEEIKNNFGKQRRGWGSIPVTVTMGKTAWETSIFPDKKSGTYILPLKSAVRKAERVSKGDIVRLTLQL